MLDDFLSYLRLQVKNRSIYIWGAQGQTWPLLTEDWIKKKENGLNRIRALKCYRAAVADGFRERLRAFDCSGLGMFWLNDLTGLAGSDMNANGMKGCCQLISKEQLSRGCWVFKVNSAKRAYHIGYVADEKLNVIEARGRAYGVVERPFSKGSWNAFGVPKWFTGEIHLSGKGASPCVFSRVMKKGSRGSDVRALQALLNKSGASLVEDGIFGSKTHTAVKEFQRECGLVEDGKAGILTLSVLGGAWCG